MVSSLATASPTMPPPMIPAVRAFLVTQPPAVHPSSRDLVELSVSLRPGRGDGGLGANRGARATEQDGCNGQGEQGDRCAGPQAPLETAGQRDVYRLALAEQGGEAGGGHRRGQRDADRPAELL